LTFESNDAKRFSTRTLTVLSMDSKQQRQLSHKEQFWQEILAAARELFAQEGYANFSMRKLAARIGYSPTTIYLYFHNKDDLLFSICEELFGRFLEGMLEIRTSRTDPLEALRCTLCSYIEVGLANPEHYKAVFFTSHEVYSPPHEFQHRDTLYRRTCRAFIELIEDCMQKDLLRSMDPNTLALVFWSAVHGMVTGVILTDDFPPADIPMISDILVNGLLKGHAA